MRDRKTAGRRKGRKRSGAETKKRILAAASRVFAARGYLRASVREVARRAGISIGGVYLYFPNKRELYTGLIRGQMDEFLGRMEGLRDEPPESALRKVVESYMEIAVTRTKMLSMSIKEFDLEFKKPLKDAFFRSQQDLISDILARGVAEGAFRKMDCNATALMILSSLRGAILAYLTGHIPTPQGYGEHLSQFFLDAIRSN